MTMLQTKEANANAVVKIPQLEKAEDSSLEKVFRIARQSQSQWQATSLKARLKVVRRLRHLIAQHARDLAGEVSRSRGVPLSEVLASEVLPLADACRFLEKNAERILQPRKLGKRGRPFWLSRVSTEIRREPCGLVLIVGPSNYPLFLPGVQLIQALVAGNAVIVKPAPQSSGAMRLMSELLIESGLPAGLFNVLPESIEMVGEALYQGVDKIVFTGSNEAGLAVLDLAAKKAIPVVAELSGCDAVFVLKSADLDRVAKALRFSLEWNRGETCIAAHRVFVDRKVVDEFHDKLVEEASSVGSQPWKIPARINQHISDALEEGAQILVGKLNQDSICSSPLILTNVSTSMSLTKTDVFAPILSIIPVDDEQDALSLNEECPFALGATVFGDEQSARTVAAKVNAGLVVINDVIVPSADPRVPFGGRKQSGYGVTRGAEGLLELTNIKVIARRRGRCRHLEPVLIDQEEFFASYIRASHGRGFFHKIRNGIAMFRQMMSKSK